MEQFGEVLVASSPTDYENVRGLGEPLFQQSDLFTGTLELEFRAYRDGNSWG